MSPREFSNMAEAYQYKMLDEKRQAVEAAKLFAYANNGKRLNAYERALDLHESKIGKTEDEIKHDKEVKTAIYKKQTADLAVYLSGLKDSKAEDLKIKN